MPWLLNVLLQHVQIFIIGELVRSSFVSYYFLLPTSLTELQTWIKQRLRLSPWHLEYFQSLTALYQSHNAIDEIPTSAFYCRSVIGKNDDVLEQTLDVDEKQLDAYSRELSNRINNCQ